MNYRKSIVITLALCLIFGSFMGVQAQEEHKRKPIVISGKSFLPLKVIARPFSNIYKEADQKSAIVEENVPVFQSYFVYTKPDTSVASTETSGWYEVGSDNRGTILGWMKADDVMEWKQAMCLAYQHPLGRKPVLMFKDLKPLQELVKLPGEARIKKAEGYYQEIETKQIPADFPIISMEPAGAIDITKQFYLLPILESAPIEIEGREGRLLKLASAPKSGRGGGTLAPEKTSPTEVTAPAEVPKEIGAAGESAESLEGAGNGSTGTGVDSEVEMQVPSAGVSAGAPVAEADLVVSDLEEGIILNKEAREKVAVDIVYVVDMTNSMQPYINSTLEAIKGMTHKIADDPAISQKVRFGLWGYRDSTDIPGMEFVTKNFTPQLQDIQSFTQAMADVRVADSGSKDFNEDVFSGVNDAMIDTNWRENALHILVIVGDAPSHQPGHMWNLSGQSAETLRTFADDNRIYIAAFHIVNPKAQRYNELAEQQLRTLSQNKGVEEAVYFAVPAGDLAKFTSYSESLATELAEMMKEGASGHVARTVQSGQDENQKESDVVTGTRNLGYAALVEWIGSQQKVEAPRDITAWVTDKDLIDPTISSLDVRVLINKKNLDSLKKTLGSIMTAGRRGEISGEKFFDALLAVAGSGVRDPDQIRNAKSLAETGLLPEFLTGLPYKSQVMEMNNETWGSLGMDQQEEFLNAIDAKLQLYVAIHDEPEGWVPLAEGADADEYVYPLSLEALP